MPKLSDISNFVKKEKILVLFLIAGLLLIIYIVLSHTKTQNQVPWQKNIVPGKTTQQEVEKTLGNPLKKEATGGSTIYYYPTQNQYRNNQVVFSNDTTNIVKEQIIGTEKGNLSDYVTKYGKPDAIVYGPHGNIAPGHFFQKEGLLVFANDFDGTIVEIWYFKPQPLDELIKNNPTLHRNFGEGGN